MRIVNRREPRGGKSASLRILLTIAVILGLTLLADRAMRPAVEGMLAYQTEMFAERRINEAMLEQLERSAVDYDELVKITRGSDGEITSIQADMAQINRLKASMSDSVIEKLESYGGHELLIPMGNIFGTQLTSGHGPSIRVKITPAGYVRSEIFNHFASAGINQTLHRIMLRVNVQMIAVLPGYNIKTATATDFCIAETVIVGDIPQGYASIGGERAAFAPFGDK